MKGEGGEMLKESRIFMMFDFVTVTVADGGNMTCAQGKYYPATLANATTLAHPTTLAR